MRSKMAIGAALVLVLGGCSQDSTDGKTTAEKSRITISAPAAGASVAGGTVLVEVGTSIEGFKVVKADGDTSGNTGHWHAFVDQDPVAPGETIGKQAGIVHSATSPIKIEGLTKGDHKITVVLGNGIHQRLGKDFATVAITVT